MLLVSLRSEALHPMTQSQQTGGPQGLSKWLTSAARELMPVHIELEPLGERETVQMVLAHHAQAAGLALATFHHSLAAG